MIERSAQALVADPSKFTIRRDRRKLDVAAAYWGNGRKLHDLDRHVEQGMNDV
jgi:hypothetical protein